MDDRDDLWLESVYSDGTAAFVSSPCPKRGETVTIRLRFYWNAPVKHVFLRTIPNGVEKLIPMVRKKEEKGLVYYEAPLQMTENRMQYQFYLVCEDVVYFGSTPILVDKGQKGRGTASCNLPATRYIIEANPLNVLKPRAFRFAACIMELIPSQTAFVMRW